MCRLESAAPVIAPDVSGDVMHAANGGTYMLQSTSSVVGCSPVVVAFDSPLGRAAADGDGRPPRRLARFSEWRLRVMNADRSSNLRTSGCTM